MSKKIQRPGFYQTSHQRISRHQNKKVKKISQQKNHKQLLEYVDTFEYEIVSKILSTQQHILPGHYKLGIWRKNISLLTRSHLPSYVKLLDYIQSNQSILVPSKALINPKKNNKSDILIEDPVTQKSRLIKLENFPILLSPQKLIFYKLSYEQFSKMANLDLSAEQTKKIYVFIQQNLEEPFSSTQYILWPAVAMEGLNYKFQQIQEIINNFKINNQQTVQCLQSFLKIVNDEAIISQSLNESFSKAQSNIQQPSSLIDNVPAQSLINQNQSLQNQNIQINNTILQVSQISHIAQQTQDTKQIKTQNKFCIWLIGTAQFIFTNKLIVPWRSISLQSIKTAFSSQPYSRLIKQSNFIIQCFNKFKKFQQSQLKGDQYKWFLYRLCVYKNQQQQHIYCIPLRFQYVKGSSKKILIKLLKKQCTELKWVSTDSTLANYTLPNINRKQMSFLYLSKKMSPIDIVINFFYRDFLYLQQKPTTQIFRSFYPQFFTNQSQAYRQRCKTCNYLIRDMPFRCCYFCRVFSHEQCTQQKKKISNTFIEELFQQLQQSAWICQRCQPCTICLEAVGQSHLFCSTCYSYFHYDCGRIKCIQPQPANVNLSLSVKSSSSVYSHSHAQNAEFICQFCLKCKMCSHKLKDNQYLIMQNQFYCSQCAQKIKSNNHCHVCMKKKQGGNSAMKWIQCGHQSCLKWVHQICDPQYMTVVKNPTATDPYLCPLCRIVQMRKVYVQVINSMIVFDEAQFFIQPSYKNIPFYDTIISQPMCFVVMKQKALEGQYDSSPYKSIYFDFNLIVNNALKFNMPKDPAHVQAKILKILGEKALQKYKQLFYPDLQSVITGTIFQKIKTLKLQLHRDINAHYPQILLNYRAQKSYIELREIKPKKNEAAMIPIESQLTFSTPLLLNNNFKNSTIIFHLKKQKIGIGNLFTMPKGENQRGIWHSVKGDLCYYHPNYQTIYSCEMCCQSYCCIKECIRHRTCAVCGLRGCRCDGYECGCPQLKEKQRKAIQSKLWAKFGDNIKTYREILMQVTQNFRYCLKCAQQKVLTRICDACQGLCSWGYMRCPDCNKVWHKKCYPYELSANYVTNPNATGLPPNIKPLYLQSGIHSTLQSNPQQYVLGSSNFSYSLKSQNSSQPAFPSSVSPTHTKYIPTSTCSIQYCKQCLCNQHPNNYQQELTLKAKSTLVKMAKITRYMRIFIQVYFNQGIRLSPYEIQQLIFDSYDQFSIRQNLFKEYQLNYGIIERFRDCRFKTNAAIQRSCAQYINDYVLVKKAKNNCNPTNIGNNIHNFNFSNDRPDHAISGTNNQQQQSQLKWIDNRQYLARSKKIWWKYFRFVGSSSIQNWQFIQKWEQTPSLYQEDQQIHLYLESIQQVKDKMTHDSYNYKDWNTYFVEVHKNKQNIINIFQPLTCPQPLPKLHPLYQLPNPNKSLSYHSKLDDVHPQNHNITHEFHFENIDNNISMLKQKINQQNLLNQQQSFTTTKQYHCYLSSLSYISTIDESYYKSTHQYRYSLIYQPRTTPYQYKLNPTFKKKSNLQMAVREFLIAIYEQKKGCLRRGSTCILTENNNITNNNSLQNSTGSSSKDYWAVFKRWAKGTKQAYIVLQKKQERWYLNINNRGQILVSEIQQIIFEITKRYPLVKIASFRELGQFLGFTIFQPFYKANHFTNFLQTNLVDQMSLLDKMNKITQLYSSFNWKQNGIFTKTGPMSLAVPGPIPVEPVATEKTMQYEYRMNKTKPPYLSKKTKKLNDKGVKKLQKRMSNIQIQSPVVDSTSSKKSFITFQDLKRYLIDTNTQTNPISSKIDLSLTLKSSPILNQVFIAPSKIHKLGLFSRKFIKKHSIVIQYVGEIVSESVADLREKRFHYGCYLFGILKEPNKQNQDKKDIIDATFRGNMARYLNHSCDPNCKAKTEYVNGWPRIVIYTIRDIAQFQEITYDYQFNVDAVEKLQCTCGAKNCQGRLN